MAYHTVVKGVTSQEIVNCKVVVTVEIAMENTTTSIFMWWQIIAVSESERMSQENSVSKQTFFPIVLASMKIKLIANIVGN